MAMLKPDDLAEHLPIQLYDANSMEIRRTVVGFDLETGQVESYCLDEHGRPRENEGRGEFLRRTEFYPAPLLWKSMTNEQAAAARRRCLDFEGK